MLKIYFYVKDMKYSITLSTRQLMVIIIDPLSLSEQTLPMSEELLALALWQSEVKREHSW